MTDQSPSRFLFESEFDSQISVLILYPEDPEYGNVQEMFEQRGHAFIYQEGKIIIVDGAAVSEPWFTDDHLKVIQAHELGHLYAQHGGVYSKEEEQQADWIGLQILKSSGMQTAVDLHMEEFKERYGVEASEIDPVYEEMFADNAEISPFLRSGLGENTSFNIVNAWRKNTTF